MNYGIYKGSRDASWRCLIDCHISTLPVKPVRIARQYGLICKDSARLLQENETGKIVRRRSGEIQILLRPDLPAPEKRFTVMHELGHYLLGHLGDEPLSRSYSTITQPEEYAAERFAVGVLTFDAETISQICNVPQIVAQRRSDRLRILRKRGKFLTSPLEQQVFQQFSNFINSTKFDKNITI